ncbi:MAG: T9SS type A sorting domain-containing protein [Cytophagales bacterium]
MEDNITMEARYNYSCGSSPWYSESRFTKKLPLIPGPIEDNSGVSLCSPNAIEFEVNSLSLYTDNFNWTAGPGSISFQTKNSRNKTIEFLSGAVPTSNQTLNLSVTGTNICGSGPTRTASFDFNQPAQKPILEMPDCWKRGNISGSMPNEIIITNPEIGVNYFWELVPHENGSAFIPAWVLNTSKTTSDVGFFNKAVDRLYIKVTAEGCIGINPFELKDFDPIDVPDNMECESGGGEERLGQNFKIFETKIYPNPAFKTLNLTFERNELRRILVFDLNGKKIDEFKVNGDFKAYDISKFQSGSYLIRIEGNDLIETHKFSVL